MAKELKIHTYKVPEDDDRHEYWETDIWCEDGRVVIGQGKTAEESKQKAQAAADKHHKFLHSGARDRLRAVLKRAKGADHLLAQDMTYAIRALAEIVLGDEP